MEIVTKYGKCSHGKSRLADVNERDSARILMYAGRPLSGVFGTTESFVKRTQIIKAGVGKNSKGQHRRSNKTHTELYKLIYHGITALRWSVFRRGVQYSFPDV